MPISQHDALMYFNENTIQVFNTNWKPLEKRNFNFCGQQRSGKDIHANELKFYKQKRLIDNIPYRKIKDISTIYHGALIRSMTSGSWQKMAVIIDKC